jgi:hypothetical protein
MKMRLWSLVDTSTPTINQLFSLKHTITLGFLLKDKLESLIFQKIAFCKLKYLLKKQRNKTPVLAKMEQNSSVLT